MSTTNQQPTTPTVDPRREETRRHVQQLRVFYTHAGVFGGSMVIIFLVNLAVNLAAGISGDWWAWWSVWALIGWGLGITIHGLAVRLSRPESHGAAWEERRIDAILASQETATSR